VDVSALLLLYRLQSRAVVRRLVGNLRTVKGVLLFVFGVAVIGLWLAPSLWQAMGMPRTDPKVVQDVAPVLLLASCLLQAFSSGGERAIAFTPAEVDFLFAGPFTRRQLLAYKVGKSVAGMAFSATLLSVVLLRHAAHWGQAWVGLFLAMMFLQLVGMAITLVGQSVGERAYTRGRKVALGLVLAAVAVVVLPAMSGGGGARPGFFEVARTLRASRVGSVVLAPLDVFGRLFTADAWWPGGWMDVGLAVAINGALLLLVFYLDADYLEAAANRSVAAYERARRVRQGGVMVASVPGGRPRGAIPRLPYCAGAGPIAWRQATSAIRNGRGMLMVLLILAVAVGPAVLAARQGGANVAGTAVGAMAWITLIVGAWLRFDFRGDLDQLDYLKSLPVRPWAMAAGQIVTPTLLMTACHLAIVGTVIGATRRADAVLVFAAVVCLPFNAMLFAIENLIFLLFPTRAAANPADFQGYGRQILLLFAKGMLTLAAAGVAGACAAIVHVTTDSWAASAATAGGVLTLIAAGLVPVVGWAFARFDVAGDVPA
jgi:hypothetical protein